MRPRTSFLAARMPDSFLEATQLWQGTCNAAVFNDWLERQLCALLNDNCVVVMDNATFHKSNKTKTLIEGKGAVLLFLPPYSPDLNPIEQDFGALKTSGSTIMKNPSTKLLKRIIKYSNDYKMP
ncbi:MAG TPA: transposase [Alphaproteobacteria bacterium]|nr:transposase [Alphaproteobacteria bacterium]